MLFLFTGFLVRRRKRLRLLNLHFFFAADERAFTRFGAKDFHTTNFTFISLAKLAHANTSWVAIFSIP